jgi:hypothetical protein
MESVSELIGADAETARAPIGRTAYAGIYGEPLCQAGPTETNSHRFLDRR